MIESNYPNLELYFSKTDAILFLLAILALIYSGIMVIETSPQSISASTVEPVPVSVSEELSSVTLLWDECDDTNPNSICLSLRSTDLSSTQGTCRVVLFDSNGEIIKTGWENNCAIVSDTPIQFFRNEFQAGGIYGDANSIVLEINDGSGWDHSLKIDITSNLK